MGNWIKRRDTVHCTEAEMTWIHKDTLQNQAAKYIRSIRNFLPRASESIVDFGYLTIIKH